MKSKRYLFYFVHPSKYYLFRNSINKLKESGCQVDIAIISKDVLEDLIIKEGWEYFNLFPEGRRSNSSGRLSILFSTAINFFKTVWRLHKLTSKKKYDVYITDDCLVITGFYRRVCSYIFIDDDLKVVPENALLYKFATNIISPECTDLGKFNRKKIGYKGYHELAYLHPKYFTPDRNLVDSLVGNNQRYSIIRLVSLTASHDINKKGIDNGKVDLLIDLLSKHGKVFISAERKLEEKYEQFRLKIDPKDIAHYLYFADLFIGDSQTMNTEAAILGTPAIRFNDFVGKISTMNEIEFNYRLSYGFKTNEFHLLLLKVEELLNNKNLKEEWSIKKAKLIKEKVDLNEWIINFFQNKVRDDNNC